MITVATKETDWYSQISKIAARSTSCGIEIETFNSENKQTTPRAWQSTVFTEHEEPLPIISVDNDRGFASSNQCVDGWIALIKEKLYANQAVEDIFVTIEENDVDVWVVIPKRDISTLRQLVEREGEIIELLVSGEKPAFFMDFHIIYRSGCNLEEVVPTRAIKLPR
jgi:hypothetical protein